MTESPTGIAGGSGTEGEVRAPTHEDFGQFIKGLELANVRVISVFVKAEVITPDPERTEVGIDAKEVIYLPMPSGFEVRQRFLCSFIETEGRREIGRIEVEFGLIYGSQIPTSDPTFLSNFEIFQRTSLRLNVWPFVREFVQSTTLRMGWPPFTLPLLK